MLCLSLWLVRPGQAQERVRNVRIRVADSSQLEIRYDLVNARPGDSIYVEVRSRLRGSLRVLPEFVRGDVGKRVVAGSDRRIVWNALDNGYSLNEEVRATVLVRAGLPIVAQSSRPAETVAAAQPSVPRPKPDVVEKPERRWVEPVVIQTDSVETNPALTDSPARNAGPRPGGPRTGEPADRTETVTPDTVTSRKKRYAGPAWALLSAVAPGFGNVFVQTPKPRIGLRPLLAVGCYGLLVYGLQERQKSRDDYTLYERQKNAETADPYYNTANSHYHRYYLATRGAIAVAAADVILTFFKGLRNIQAAKKASLQSVTLRPGLQAGQPTAVVRYSF